MRNSRVLLALAASMLFLFACASKEEPARQTVAAAEANLSAIRDQAAQFAPEQLQVAEANLAAARENITWEKYDVVIEKAPELNQSIVTLKEVVVAKQTQLAAATHEWESLNEEVPKLVQAIESHISNLPKAKREAATASLEEVKAAWADATAAFTAGNPTEAADKGRLVQSRAKAVSEQLGVSPV